MEMEAGMTPERLREILNITGWGVVQTATNMGRDPRELRRWLAGTREVDPACERWLEVQAANPPPGYPRRED
jgi:hypothetical protein